MASDTQVTLIPWDPQSASHRAWLLRHREECGWDQEKVEGVWVDYQTRGIKCIFWIQTNYLHDTAQLLNGVPRHPTNTKFVPVGHISLDSQNPGVETIGVTSSAPGMFWIKTFFVSRTVQSKGVGRAAMDEVEAMAGRAPLSAKTLVLDVIVGEDQMREDFALATSGFIPKFTTEGWYLRRGYQPFKTVQNFYDAVDQTGKHWDMRTTFMKKEIR
ncbi:hypothetical protein PDE_06352 [Penicillium oxalicum 114-2]|uniref:N-acetyltransferase domain-containing protein n=1 Tax=Penicillium oxalicum (strain 114-2 / CGMCC 5302) TaxID=933388 RepID=S8B9F0_PENO1|nr:hypothetical protein PDE_06352 [Penicillium oxalicum 114-2]